MYVRLVHILRAILKFTQKTINFNVAYIGREIKLSAYIVFIKIQKTEKIFEKSFTFQEKSSIIQFIRADISSGIFCWFLSVGAWE